MSSPPVDPRLRQQLVTLGVPRGWVVLVHAAFSKIKPVDGGPAGLIAALEDIIGPLGTLVMPSMSDDDDHPFDPATTPCLGMGVVADTFWRLPGVLRSDSPHAFAAKGPAAPMIAAPHPIDFPHGPDSPVGRVLQLDGVILLLGVGHEADTTVHLAEAMAAVRYRVPKSVTVMQDGQVVRQEYLEIDHCCKKFSLVDGWLDAARLQRRGTVGSAEARLVRARSMVEVVTAHLREEETVFLHPKGVDAECDEARDSLKRRHG